MSVKSIHFVSGGVADQISVGLCFFSCHLFLHFARGKSWRLDIRLVQYPRKCLSVKQVLWFYTRYRAWFINPFDRATLTGTERDSGFCAYDSNEQFPARNSTEVGVDNRMLREHLRYPVINNQIFTNTV